MVKSSSTHSGEGAAGRARHDSTRREVARAVGLQVKTLRRHLEMTAAEVSRRVGISPSMLTKIEKGQTAASIVTLAALADVLGVPIARLFSGHDGRHDCSIVRAGHGLKVERNGTRAGHSYQLIGHSLSGELFVEPYLVTTHTGANPYNSFQHKGVEFLYMLEGRMGYRYADQLIDLKPGDSLLFDATALHGPEVIGDGPLRYLVVVANLRA